MDWHYNCSIDYGYTFKKNLPDGKYYAYSPQNIDLILAEAKYEKRKKSGEWRTYNPYKKTQQYQRYENGQLLTEKFIDSLGRITYEVKFVNKQKFGHYYSFYNTGQLESSEEFWRHKRRSTQVITKYYLNGQVESIIRYENNKSNTKPIGKWAWYYEDGKPKKFEEFGKNWKRIGIWREWDADGKIVSQTDYSVK